MNEYNEFVADDMMQGELYDRPKEWARLLLIWQYLKHGDFDVGALQKDKTGVRGHCPIPWNLIRPSLTETQWDGMMGALFDSIYEGFSETYMNDISIFNRNAELHYAHK